MNCIDVSEWNKEIDFNAVKNSGVDYVIIRAGFGSSGVDKYYHINMEEAKNAGLKIGVYFYSYARDWDSATIEAEHCIDLISEYKNDIDLPIFYDVEEPCNISRVVDVCMAFINKLNYYGYNAGIYTPASWYSAYFKDISTDYIWIAYTGETKPEWCDIWQFSHNYSVDGVRGNVDANIVYNTDMRLLINEPEPTPLDNTVNIDILVDAPENIKVNVNIHHVKKD